LAKLSLWLVTLARDHAFTFIDHALKHGDSLVGLSRKQIAAFHWKPDSGPAMDLFEDKLRQDIEEALGWRDTLQGLEEGDYNQKKEAWREAENALSDARLIGDLVVSAFFGAESDKGREELRNRYRSKLETWRTDAAHWNELENIVLELRGGERPVPPMHWELEFPEVFWRENPGFDAFVGNPPFMGGSKVSSTLGYSYLHWLITVHDEAHGNGDLVAHFFRRAFKLLRWRGALGLIATNTVAQGDTRTTGLHSICSNKGEIFAARRRVKWPGLAAVVVSVVHLSKGSLTSLRMLDGREAETITAFLFHRGGHESPMRLEANAGQSFLGNKTSGLGFLFSDDNTQGVATSIAEMERLVTAHPAAQEAIFPYIGGEEVNSSPTHAHRRFVINFAECAENECRQRWPELMAIVEAKVRPGRLKLANNADGRRRKKYWWQFGRYTPALAAAIGGLERVMVISRVGNACAFCFKQDRHVFSERLVVFPLTTNASFAALQSRVHEVWTRFLSATLKDDLMYAPSDCFETFPFPAEWQTDPNLERAGETYYEFRSDLMVRNDEGLTKTYNRFHDPEERDPDILTLREMHAAMDRAVLDAYGWDEIPTDCEFLLDYDIDEETWGAKKKPYRYRWPEVVYDEVLTRLLDLNQKRYAEEVAAGLHAEKGTKRSSSKKTQRGTATSTDAAHPLFGSAMKPSGEV
jgi:hypothetical protein